MLEKGSLKKKQKTSRSWANFGNNVKKDFNQKCESCATMTLTKGSSERTIQQGH